MRSGDRILLSFYHAMMRIITCSLILLALLLGACGSSIPPAPANLQGDDRVHDPAIIREGQTYYIFSTGEERGYRGGTIQIRRSTDLINWERVGSVFDAIPPWVATAIGSSPPNLWAPDIVAHNGQFYLYYAGSRFGTNTSVIGLATNTTLDPSSPVYRWVDQGPVIQSTTADNWNAIDPAVSFDADGTPWLSFGSFWDGIKMRRIDPNTGKLAQDDTTLYDLASRGGGPIEAPSIVRHDDWYYLFVSFDFCCRGTNSTYNIRVGRSKQITGPYLDREGRTMMQGGGTQLLESNGRFVGPGGQSVYNDSGTVRLVHHYYDRDLNGVPRLQIHDLAWDNDGWPMLART